MNGTTPLNNSIMIFVEQGFETLGSTNVYFGIKVLAIFGFFYLLNMAGKTGGSLLNLLVYVYAFIKWVIFKIRGKEI